MHLEQGDGLVLEDGRVAEVSPPPEDLMEVAARDPRHLVRARLAHRQPAPARADRADRILIRRDRIIRDMLEQLGATVTRGDGTLHARAWRLSQP